MPDSRIVSALDLKMVSGHYALDRNPFCSISKLLHDSQEVKDASSSGRVVASHDGTVGVEIIRPFAPDCRAKAQRKLDRVAGLGHNRKAGKNEKKSKHGGGNGG